MVSIHSEPEHQFVLGLNAEGAWIGSRRDLGDRNNWVWLDGTSWDYDNWLSGEPNDQGGAENCILMYNSLWVDTPCGLERTSFQYILDGQKDF